MTTETTIIGTFKDEKFANKALQALHEEGFPEQGLTILQGGTDAIAAELVKRGFDKQQARDLAEAAEQGKTLLAALVAEDKADKAAAILDRLEAAQEQVREYTVPSGVNVVEEELVVGKDKVATGGVRVTSSVEEQPVEKTVALHEERVRAEERPVDRELTPAEAATAFQEKTVEVLATAEEAEISKKARVVGEVAIEREVAERQETVHDTVRRTNVEIENVGTKPRRTR